MAESVWIGWLGPIRFEASGSTVIFPGNLQAERFLGADGTAAAPTFSFYGTGDGDNGMYLSAADTLGWSAGGTLRLSLSSSALISTLSITAPRLVAATSTDLDLGAGGSGWWRIAAATGNLTSIDNGSSFGWADVSLSRGAAGRVDTTKAFRMTPVAFTALPTAAEGAIASVNDSNTASWGATIAGGGANKVLAYYNGTNWTVAGA